MKVCHVTSVHKSDDIRIFVKECNTLADAGYDTILVAPGVRERRTKVGRVEVVGCGTPPSGRVERANKFAKSVYEIAIAEDAEVYHFHDPEMLKYAAKLAVKGKKVIFDSHEDVPGQIKSKPWIPAPLRGTVSRAYKAYETKNVKKLSAVVAATDYIADLFKGRTKKVVVVKNYPKLDDIEPSSKSFKDRERIACYAGGISHIRGEEIMVSAIGDIDDAYLKLAGNCESDEIKNSKPKNVEYLGKVDRAGVNDLYSRSRVGLCLLLPVPNYVNSLPTKIFEYMAAGIPAIASNFPLCKEIIEESNCGVVLDPTDHDAVVNAIKYYLDNPDEAEKAGQRGREAAVTKYNWANEGKTLIDLYDSICSDNSTS